MRFDNPNNLGKDEARRRITKLFDYWHSKYGVQVSWTDDSARLVGSVKGVAFDATITVGDTTVQAEGTDPGLLMRALTTSYLKKKLAMYLDPSKKLEDIVE
jgi:hypothetical protein